MLVNPTDGEEEGVQADIAPCGNPLQDPLPDGLDPCCKREMAGGGLQVGTPPSPPSPPALTCPLQLPVAVQLPLCLRPVAAVGPQGRPVQCHHDGAWGGSEGSGVASPPPARLPQVLQVPLGTPAGWGAQRPRGGPRGGEDALTRGAGEAGQPAQPGIPLGDVLALERRMGL